MVERWECRYGAGHLLTPGLRDPDSYMNEIFSAYEQVTGYVNLGAIDKLYRNTQRYARIFRGLTYLQTLSQTVSAMGDDMTVTRWSVFVESRVYSYWRCTDDDRWEHMFFRHTIDDTRFNNPKVKPVVALDSNVNWQDPTQAFEGLYHAMVPLLRGIAP